MGGFDRSLLHVYKEWEPIVPNFAYHGLNTYTYLLSKYGKYIDKCNEGSERDTFDFVTIQLYEGYSHAEYNTTKIGQPGTEYLISYLNSLWNGWNIDFSTDAELNYPVKAFMKLEIPRTVVGLANGWAGDGKFFLMYPDQVSVFDFETYICS